MMARLQQRGLKVVAAAAIFILVVLYTYHSTPVTWEGSSIPTPTPIPTQSSLPNAGTNKASSLEVIFTHDSPYNPELEKGGPLSIKPTASTPTSTPTLVSAPLQPLVVASDEPSLSTPTPLIYKAKEDCVRYESLQNSKQKPWSEGWRQFPYSRPSPECRTFSLPAMETLIEKMKKVIKDSDLLRLFENAYPNTLDTMVKWRGFAKDPITEEITDEELTYVITGDIDAMWLRDSASQILSYLPLLEASTDPNSLASLWRGLINIHARYIIISPYCHSFQPPPESGISPTHNGAYTQNHPNPPYDPIKVFDCKWELDSLASFLQISTAYYERTKDVTFFGRYNWVAAVEAAVKAAGAMRLGTYSKDGKVQASAWTFTGWTSRGSETLTNDGLGNPTKENGMVRSAFRPSDDACIYQLLVPANMMWAKYLEEGSLIMEQLEGETAKNMTSEMRDFAYGIRRGIDNDAIVHHREFGDIFAYEIDGYGASNLMDDANVPSLLAMPLWNYTKSSFKLPPPIEGEKLKDYEAIYANTRKFVLSDSNPYFMKGPIISAIGGPHLGPGKAWPMAAIIRAITAFATKSWSSGIKGSEDLEEEIKLQMGMVLNSTSGTGGQYCLSN